MSNAGFDFAIAFTMWQESYDDRAVDLGDGAGLTKYGITQRSHPTVDIQSLTLAGAFEIYEREYWTATNASALPMPLGVAMFDAAVNHGGPTAVRLLQRACGVAEDGELGPITAAAASRNVARTLRKFCVQRGLRYAQHPQWTTFGPTWLERLEESYAFCLGLPD